MDLKQVQHGFSSFFAQIFAIFDYFSKYHSTFSVLHFEKFALNQFLHDIAGRYTRN